MLCVGVGLGGGGSFYWTISLNLLLEIFVELKYLKNYYYKNIQSIMSFQWYDKKRVTLWYVAQIKIAVKIKQCFIFQILCSRIEKKPKTFSKDSFLALVWCMLMLTNWLWNVKFHSCLGNLILDLCQWHRMLRQ